LGACSAPAPRSTPAPVEDRTAQGRATGDSTGTSAATSTQQESVRISAYRAPPPLETARPEPGKAVTALLSRADDQIADGQLAAASSSLERAAGIEPRNPEVWARLAQLRRQQGEYQRAIDFAAKSNSFAGSADRALKHDNWQLIAACRRALGDTSGAAAAEAQARALQ